MSVIIIILVAIALLCCISFKGKTKKGILNSHVPNKRLAEESQRVTNNEHNEDKVRIEIKSFLDTYSQYASIPDDTFAYLLEAQLQNKSYIFLEKDLVKMIYSNYQQNKKKEELLLRCTELNNKGIEYEKDGEIEKAISCYEKNLLNEYPAIHSYDRLMIIYRKKKDFENEIRVIEKAIKILVPHYPELDSKYKARIEKAIKLNQVQNKNVL